MAGVTGSPSPVDNLRGKLSTDEKDRQGVPSHLMIDVRMDEGCREMDKIYHEKQLMKNRVAEHLQGMDGSQRVGICR